MRTKDERGQPHVPTICVDFDGVVHKYSRGWIDGAPYDDPVQGAVTGIKHLQRIGYRVVILTAREESNLTFVRAWLEKHNIHDVEVTREKPIAIMYVDDRGLRFTTWQDLINYV